MTWAEDTCVLRTTVSALGWDYCVLSTSSRFLKQTVNCLDMRVWESGDQQLYVCVCVCGLLCKVHRRVVFRRRLWMWFVSGLNMGGLRWARLWVTTKKANELLQDANCEWVLGRLSVLSGIWCPLFGSYSELFLTGKKWLLSKVCESGVH